MKGESRVQKIENQEKKTLKGAERSGVWRRGDKGRGLIRNRDKYGAMHHSGNTGRNKTVSHETGKTLRCFFVTTQSDGIMLDPLQTTEYGTIEHRCDWTLHTYSGKKSS